MNTIAAISVIFGCISAIIIAFDISKHSQSMKIMNPVWILTGLWAGVFAIIAYFWFGKQKTMQMGEKMDMNHMNMPKRPYWQSVTLSTLHCGAGCTLADLIGEWFLYFVPVAIGGNILWGSVVIDYTLALIIGIYFQYVAIKSMSSMKPGQIITKAIKADILSLTSWQVGMYGFMAIVIFGLFSGQSIPKTSWIFWFMMQLAMFVGFMLSFPVNVLLIKWKIKKAM